MMNRGGVYFIRPDGDDVVKIGSTESLRSRISALQTGSARPLHVLLFLRPPADVSYTDLESRFHARFADYRMEGEWFRLEGEVAEFLERNNRLAFCPCPRCSRGSHSRCFLCKVGMFERERNLYLVDDKGNGYCDDCIWELEEKSLTDQRVAFALAMLMSTATPIYDVYADAVDLAGDIS